VDDLDFIDLISVADYSEEWEKKKKPIQKKIRRYYLLHEVGVKGLFLSAAGAVLLLQYTPYSYLLTFHAFTCFRLVKTCKFKGSAFAFVLYFFKV